MAKLMDSVFLGLALFSAYRILTGTSEDLPMGSSHALTIKLPPNLFRAATELAANRGISLAILAREAIEEKTMKRAEEDLSAAYETMAEDSETDVDAFFEAQAEAVRKG